ncbi:MAG: iron-containing alcohol dehydrogenase [Planctomycetes bacterium]|nr:iron-containing alcohol dehydrogenase [Planctomycetota bacterium]
MSKRNDQNRLLEVVRRVAPDSPVRVVFGNGRLVELGAMARDEGATRVLLVTDPGIVAAGHVDRALTSLRAAGLETAIFDGARENPTTAHVAAGVEVGRRHDLDFIVGLGGGSSMDCAKGVNLIVSNGGRMADYRGVNQADRPMRPMILAPTTAGTGSEAQSFALISDPQSREKMVCGDRRPPRAGGLRPRVAILDPELTRSQPPEVAAAAGIDAIGHAVEASATKARTDLSRRHCRQAWALLEGAYVNALRDPGDDDARAGMLLGAHLAGLAIEESMLGAAHSLANPLTACCGLVHGVAVGLMLPHVVRFNTADGQNHYSDLDDDAERLAVRLESFLEAAGLPRRLCDCGVADDVLPDLAVRAATQWTAKFNPTPVGEAEMLDLYRQAYA